MDRRSFMKTLAAGAVAGSVLSPAALASAPLFQAGNGLGAGRLPKRLKVGDTVRMVAPASAVQDRHHVLIAKESFEALGFKVQLGEHVFGRYGYLSGTDQQRAEDVNNAFADDSVDAVIAVRGGWGCNRILPLLDYDMIRSNNKVLLGYSDITSLMNALYVKTGMVSFHGPNGFSYWADFQAQQFRDVIMDGKSTTMRNYKEKEETLTMMSNRTTTVNSGKAQGVLVGGNLTVLTSLCGTPYFPDLSGKILMLEDVGENIYRIDRFLSQLQLAGHLDDVAGIVFGHCTECDPGGGFGSFTLHEVFEHYFKPLGVPTYTGAQFGHIRDNHILPVGHVVELDADDATVRLIGSAVA
ncbi:S66 peptidase family protein [Pseudidiomarina insulisalsae]|uniref:LD-carboxypeptidase n=1 Tax=Pseudidiomarina insulisalsae TaxID=575789 RepID=A0A432YMR3_9GAMM|nr:LD-carboxypeptidase [Pseudidiomarina insulisalsae]RUO62198.1 LD-carboxypeptidase [Pseudidiomarina insulisalsae]